MRVCCPLFFFFCFPLLISFFFSFPLLLSVLFADLFVQLKVDEKETGRTVLLSKKYMWNESFSFDVTGMQEFFQFILWTRKSKVLFYRFFLLHHPCAGVDSFPSQGSKDNLLGSNTVPKELIAVDSNRHELWFPIKEEKEKLPSVRLEIRLEKSEFFLEFFSFFSFPFLV